MYEVPLDVDVVYRQYCGGVDPTFSSVNNHDLRIAVLSGPRAGRVILAEVTIFGLDDELAAGACNKVVARTDAGTFAEYVVAVDEDEVDVVQHAFVGCCQETENIVSLQSRPHRDLLRRACGSL